MTELDEKLKLSKFEELKDLNKMLDVELVCLRTSFLTLDVEVHSNMKNIKDIVSKIEELIKLIPKGDRHEKSR